MRSVLDSHAHTIASGHAYNTIYEMAQTAAEKGLELLALTDGCCGSQLAHTVHPAGNAGREHESISQGNGKSGSEYYRASG